MIRTDTERFIYQIAYDFGERVFTCPCTFEELKRMNLIIGVNPDLSKDRSEGYKVHREELDNQPKIRGYIGPMYNGIEDDKIVIRYETPKVYKMLSE